MSRSIFKKTSAPLLADLALKAALIALVLVALLWPDLPQFDGDNHATWRALTYPISLVIVPVGWKVFGRKGSRRYPYELDLLLPVPLVIDAAAPALYHSVAWWDKLMHIVTWSSLAAASVLLLTRCRVERATAAAFAVGFGLSTAVLWELWEYVAWVRNSPALMQTEFADTLGDFLCDLAAIAFGIVATWLLREAPGGWANRNRAFLAPMPSQRATE